MRRRELLFGAGAVAAGMALSGCNSGGGGTPSEAPKAEDWRSEVTGGPIEAGVLTAKGTPGLTYLEQLAKKIESEVSGSKITLTFANTEARPALEQRWRGGDGLDVDYGMFDGTNPAQRVWADDGMLLDLKSYLEQNDPATGKPWLENFSPAARGFMTHPDTGGIFGIPTELSTQVLFYNAKLFTEKSITPPTTWTELIAAVEALKSAGVDPIAVTGLFQPYMGMWSDNLWLRTVGWEAANKVLVTGEGHITENPGFLAGLQHVQELRDANAFIKGFQGTDFTPAQALFFQNKAGMILMGNWLVSEMKAVIPKGFEVGVLPFPAVDGGAGDQKALMAAAQLISINAESKNLGMALTWASRVTSVEVQTERATKLGDLSAVVGVPSPTGVTGIDKIISEASALVPREFSLSGTKVYEPYYAEIARLFFGEQDAQQTLDRLDQLLRKQHKN
ncbi:ABC transporter substrate-binding protein [Microlunatus sp. GCM10028923]|uniref:ABC transporter substrate-binding protein n=1 Tax=Microlunatus sp. GCM10028923 TaxID=3273400 RepID=UPI00361A1270